MEDAVVEKASNIYVHNQMNPYDIWRINVKEIDSFEYYVRYC